MARWKAFTCLATLWAALAPLARAHAQVVYITDSPTVLEASDPGPSYVLGFGGEADQQAPSQPHRSMLMRSANGTTYRCYIPDPNASEEEAGSSVSTTVEGSLLARRTPTELLEALGEHCYYRIEEWWSYELCYGKKLRQYHKESGKVVAQYVLGRYTPEQPQADEVQADSSEVSGTLRYVTHRYLDGEVCELTGQPRQAEVRFTCAPGGEDTLLTSVKELASCHYLATISTPRLCKHPAFQQQPAPATLIQCHPLSGDAAGAAAGGGKGSCGAGMQQQADGTCGAAGADAGGVTYDSGVPEAAAAGGEEPAHAAATAAADNASLAAAPREDDEEGLSQLVESTQDGYYGWNDDQPDPDGAYN